MQAPTCPLCKERHWVKEGHAWDRSNPTPFYRKQKRPTTSDKVLQTAKRINARPAPTAIGIPTTGKVGRPRVHQSNAEKQRAYRLRKKTSDK